MTQIGIHLRLTISLSYSNKILRTAAATEQCTCLLTTHVYSQTTHLLNHMFHNRARLASTQLQIKLLMRTTGVLHMWYANNRTHGRMMQLGQCKVHRFAVSCC